MASSRDDFSPTSSWQTEESVDDDMDFELASDDISDVTSSAMGTGEEEEEEEGDGQTTIYFDAEDGTFRDSTGDEITLEMGSEQSTNQSEDSDAQVQNGNEGSQTPRPARTQTITITQQQILQLLSHAGIRGIFQPSSVVTRSQSRAQQVNGEDDNDDDDDDDNDDDEDQLESYLGYGRRRSRRIQRTVVGERYPKIPSDEGTKVMQDGTFGNNDRCDHTACGLPLSENTLSKRKLLARRMLDRELGIASRGRARALNGLTSQNLIPSSKADLIINANARCYSGQFSEDGSFFFACGQDFKVRMYDTSNPYDWKYYKTVHYYGGQWTITDASLSPDNKYLAYSSIRTQVCLANTERGDSSEPQLLDFSDMGGRGTPGGGGGWGRSLGHFGIWSLRFSGDGAEIVAGTSDSSVYVYDLEARRSILRIPGHEDEVNAVCFGDKMSPHILYSGSDDTTVKVWDRRSLASMRPAGMFLGHTEGVTYIDSRGDGRYVISNAKDQTCKLWDLRKMISTDEGERINPQHYTTNFDYRFSPYDVNDHQPHPHDCSLVTFRGHRVLKTLIRCHFSPPGSTDGRYIYSGSHDGKIYVWNLDGTAASSPIDVRAATKNTRPASDERYVDRYDYHGRGGVWKTIVRDCSWHPSAPVIAATSWNGWDHNLGTWTVHSWSDGVDYDEVGEPSASGGDQGPRAEAYARAPSLGSTPVGARVSAQLQHDPRFYGGQAAQDATARTRRTRLRDRMGLGAFWGDSEE